jgi:hypothetical protein
VVVAGYKIDSRKLFLLQTLQRVRDWFQETAAAVDQSLRSLWGEDLRTSAPVSATCSRTCQCKNYRPCHNPEHNPCTFEIGFEKNHTHVVIELAGGADKTVRNQKICVSPKCLDPFPRASSGIPMTGPSVLRFFDENPRIRCYQCYFERQKRRDLRMAVGSSVGGDQSGSSIVWSWRRSNSI